MIQVYWRYLGPSLSLAGTISTDDKIIIEDKNNPKIDRGNRKYEVIKVIAKNFKVPKFLQHFLWFK